MVLHNLKQDFFFFCSHKWESTEVQEGMFTVFSRPDTRAALCSFRMELTFLCLHSGRCVKIHISRNPVLAIAAQRDILEAGSAGFHVGSCENKSAVQNHKQMSKFHERQPVSGVRGCSQGEWMRFLISSDGNRPPPPPAAQLGAFRPATSGDLQLRVWNIVAQNLQTLHRGSKNRIEQFTDWQKILVDLSSTTSEMKIKNPTFFFSILVKKIKIWYSKKLN